MDLKFYLHLLFFVCLFTLLEGGFKLVDAFIYMYFIGAGTTLGVATIAFISWKVVIRSKNKTSKRRK